ncbi:serine hydrolase [Corynebacterium sp. 335C]
MLSLRNGRRRAALAVVAAATAAGVLAAPAALAEPSDSDGKTESAEHSRRDADDADEPAGKPAADRPAEPLPALDYDEVQKRMEEATEEMEAEGVQMGMALYDRATGRMVSNVNGEKPFPLASIVKVFVAEVVAYSNYERPEDGEIERGRGEMPREGNQDAMLRDSAMRYSDNEATSALWAAYGRGEIVESVRERYGLSDATQPRANWAASTSSPEDMAKFFAGVLDGEGGLSEDETDYLVRLMYSLPKYSYGNAGQDFGLREALDGEMVAQKGGWSDPHIRASAGFLGEDQRFTMAVLTTGDETSTAATRAVEMVFPDGIVVPHLDDDAKPGEPVASPVEDGPGMPVAGLVGLTALGMAVIGFLVGWAVRGTRVS